MSRHQARSVLPITVSMPPSSPLDQRAAVTDAGLLLLETERRLQLALSAGRGVGTWDWDVLNNLVVSDARFARIFGVDPELAKLGVPVEHFFRGIHPDDLPRVQFAIEDALRTGRSFSEEYRVRDASGTERWVIAEG